MKKMIKCGACALGFVAVMSFMACKNDEDEEPTSATGTDFSSYNVGVVPEEPAVSTGTATASADETWIFDAASTEPIFEVAPSVKSVAISGAVGGKHLYLVRANPSSEKIEAASVRTVASLSSTSAPTISLPSANIASSALPSLGNLESASEKITEDCPRIDFDGELKEVFDSSRSAESARAAVNFEVGAEKEFFVRNTSTTFVKKKATLRAKGDNFYIWVVNEDFTNGEASGKNINQAGVDAVKENFGTIYSLVRNVFGEEPEQILELIDGGERFVRKAISDFSETGSNLNIVMSDIDLDYTDDDGTYTAGYFWEKDFYYSKEELSGSSAYVNGSNVGKYLYIDTAMARINPEDTILTVAHEFQHMVNCGMNYFRTKASPKTWYDEMLSMLCEDMMQAKFELEDDATPKQRTSRFNTSYFNSGICRWGGDSTSAKLASYANVYTFGAWLARQYGGAKLVEYIAKNESVDVEAIVKAVNGVNSTNLTFRELFKKFLLAVTGNSTYTHNKDAETKLPCDGYNYPMTGYNIFDYEILAGADYNDHKANYVEPMKTTLKGPAVFMPNYIPGAISDNYGFTLHDLGELPEVTEDVTVGFAEEGVANLYMYLIVQ